MADLEDARDRVRWGREKKSRAIEEEDKKVTALIAYLLRLGTDTMPKEAGK